MTVKVKWERVSLGAYGNYYRTTDPQGREWTLQSNYGGEWDIQCDGKYQGTAYAPQALSEAKRRASELIANDTVRAA